MDPLYILYQVYNLDGVEYRKEYIWFLIQARDWRYLRRWRGVSPAVKFNSSPHINKIIGTIEVLRRRLCSVDLWLFCLKFRSLERVIKLIACVSEEENAVRGSKAEYSPPRKTGIVISK